MEHAIQQFRITTWPSKLPHPPVREQAPYEVAYSHAEGGALHFDFTDAPEDEDEFQAWLAEEALRRQGLRPGRRLPGEVAETGEIYLELIDVRLDDVDSILDFVERFGVLGTSYANYDLFVELPGFEIVLPELRASWRFDVPPLVAGRFRTRHVSESLVQFRFAARCMRDLVTAWRIVQADNDVGDSVTWEAIPPGYSHIPRWDDDVIGDPIEVDSRTAVWHFLANMIEMGLLPFHPRLVRDPALNERDRLFEGVPLYSVCCLELFNHIAEHASYRHCANERCERTFVRQTGRAAVGQHRTTGIKYCSSHCARAQAQRQHRARSKRA